MLKVLILTALLAVSLAAPAPAPAPDHSESHGLSRPSPINPDVVSDPRPKDRVVLSDTDVKHHHVNVTPVSPDGHLHKRSEDEKEAEKPQDVKDTKVETHSHGHDEVACLTDSCRIKSKVSKRDTHTDRPEKPHSVIAKEGLQHNPQRKEPTPDHSKDIKAPQVSERAKKPLPVVAREGLQHNPHRTNPLTVDHTKDTKAPIPAKVSKRETHDEHPQKPHPAIGEEGLKHLVRVEPPNFGQPWVVPENLTKIENEPKRNKRDTDAQEQQKVEKPHPAIGPEVIVEPPKFGRQRIVKEPALPEEPQSVQDTPEDVPENPTKIENEPERNKRDTNAQKKENVEKPSSASTPNPDLEKAVKTIEDRLAAHKGEPAKKQKRDIPVPTVPKFQHPEKSEDKPESAPKQPLAEKEVTSTEHPVIRHKPVSVAELFARPQHNDEKVASAAAAAEVPPAVPIPATAVKA